MRLIKRLIKRLFKKQTTVPDDMWIPKGHNYKDDDNVIRILVE